MALDVHIKRVSEESWGFEILGGADEAPLRVDKIQPNSPADKAGLQNGDMILSINGAEAIDMLQVDARRAVAECEGSLKLGVMRGLYDPVLDDQEPICEPYEPDDSDRPSAPTEVPFKIQQFIEAPEPLQFLEPPPFADSRSLTSSPFVVPAKPYRPFSTEPIEVPSIEDPIILNPEFIDQFGLGSEEFNPDDLLGSYYKDAFEKTENETKFKLPVSEKYDPEGHRVKIDLNIEKTFKYIEFIEARDVVSKEKVIDIKNKEVTNKIKSVTTVDAKNTNKGVNLTTKENVTSVKDIKNVNKHISSEENHLKENVEDMVKEELRYIEKMKQEIDLDKIEETALSVVDESIERAVSVAEEIKKEIDGELITDRRESKTKISSEIDEIKSENDHELIEPTNEEPNVEAHETTEAKHKARKDSQSENNKYESKQDEDAEVLDHKYNIREEEKSEMRRESRTYESDTKERKMSIQKQTVKPTVKKEHKSDEEIDVKEEQESIQEDRVEFEGKETRHEFSNVSNSVHSDAEQRIYSIGLQTIPNIRGVVTSSYHYDLLLKTFFIHLTDVMVALSRFILTQPVFNHESKTVTETKTHESGVSQVKKRKESKIEKDMKTQSDVVEKRVEQIKSTPVVEVNQEKIQKNVKQMKGESTKVESESKQERIVRKESIKTEAGIQKDVKQEMRVENELKQEKHESRTTNNASEVTEKRKVSGSSMAKLSEKKLSQDLTQKMDAVVAEFQTKATSDSIDMVEIKKQINERKRRSRSRSQVEEEVMRESDPLEWLAKVDSRSASQDRTEERKEFSSTSESFKKNTFEYNYENKQPTRNKKPRQTYIAIVESHVYTNHDAIFEEQVSELSETSSVQSAEEMNTAFEALQMETTENVAIENAVRELETAKTVVEGNYLDIATSKCEATVKMANEILYDTKEITDYKTEEKAIVKNDIQEVLVQESRDIIEPVIDIQDNKFETVNFNINQTLTTAESYEININESKKDINNIKEVKEETLSIVEEDYRENAVKTEVIADEFTEVAHAQQMESKYEVVKPEYQVIEGEDVTERVVLKSDKDKKYESLEASAELKVVRELEIETQAEIIEIEDETEIVRENGVDAQSVINKLEILKALEIDESENITEKSMVTSGFDSNILSKETVIKQESESISKSGGFKLDQSQIKETQKQFVINQADATLEFESSQSAVSKLSQSVGKADQYSEIKETSLSSEFESKSATQLEMSTERSLASKMELQKNQESSFTANSDAKKLTIDTEIALNREISAQSDENNNIDTPTPSTVPPTPLVDNYIFKLTVPLPKSRCSTPIPRDCTPPNEEDPRIVKKKLIPHIETTIESVIYDPPLPSPPGSKVQSPVYTKPGLRGGSDRPYWKNRKEEIREIGRKSSLLASAIDETIKSIEEYKEEVGIDSKNDVQVKELKSKEVIKSLEKSFNKEVTEQNGTSQIESNFEKSVDLNENSKPKESVNKIDIEVGDSATKTTKTEECKVKSVSFKTENELIEGELTEGEHTVHAEEETENLIKSLINTEMDTESRETTKMELSKVNAAENFEIKEKSESLPGFRPVVFDPEAIPKREVLYLDVPQIELPLPSQDGRQSPYLTETGESIGTIQGIVDGLEEVVIDPEVARKLGKPGIPEEKIAELISGESDMLREAHLMGLARVINSHMHRIDDADEESQKIKPVIDSLKDSEVLKALNEDILKTKEQEKKKDEKKWTKFLQKPKRAVPKAMFGYHGWTAPAPEQECVEEPYKVKIVKQPKPKVAPDYKPEDFDTGPLPWEERQLIEASLPPVEPEEPILIPEEVPEFLEAVDPLPESEVPDLEDTGIPLSPVQSREPTPPVVTEELPPVVTPEPKDPEEEEKTEFVEEREGEMDNRLAEQLVRSVKSMVDPNATLEQQLVQMRAQLAALAQLPEVIQQSLELVAKQLSQIGKQELSASQSATKSESYQDVEATENHTQEESHDIQKQVTFENSAEESHQMNGTQEDKMAIEETVEYQKVTEEKQNMGEVDVGVAQQINEEKAKSEKQKKDQLHQAAKQRPAPRACKPQPKFGRLSPEQRAVVLPGGRRWRNTEDVYNEQLIAETLTAQAELIQGKALGFESEHLPCDTRINFMKYEKPPVSLEHLQNSEVYKLVHNMDQEPVKRLELRTPVMAEADYRERCRSATPSIIAKNRLDIPQQFHP